ncbi:MAG: sulfotransferase [Bacteroidota bacterium]
MNFVIITPGRSGSTFLAQTLNQHSEIVCEGEIFNRAEFYEGSFNHFLQVNPLRKTIAFLFNRERLSTSKINYPLEWLIQQFHSQKRTDKKRYGFKISLDQLFAYPQLISVIKTSCKIIYLTREDKTRLVLSLMTARKTGNYEKFGGRHVYFAPRKVKQQLNLILKQERNCRDLLPGSFELTYEQLVRDQANSFLRISNYLELKEGIPTQSSNAQKAHPENISDWVGNIDEIERYLRA